VLYGERYLIEPGRCLRHDKLRKFVVETLPYYDYEQTLTFYTAVAPKMTIEEQAFLGCNDRFFLLKGEILRIEPLNARKKRGLPAGEQ